MHTQIITKYGSWSSLLLVIQNIITSSVDRQTDKREHKMKGLEHSKNRQPLEYEINKPSVK